MAVSVCFKMISVYLCNYLYLLFLQYNVMSIFNFLLICWISVHFQKRLRLKWSRGTNKGFLHFYLNQTFMAVSSKQFPSRSIFVPSFSPAPHVQPGFSWDARWHMVSYNAMPAPFAPSCQFPLLESNACWWQCINVGAPMTVARMREAVRKTMHWCIGGSRVTFDLGRGPFLVHPISTGWLLGNSLWSKDKKTKTQKRSSIGFLNTVLTPERSGGLISHCDKITASLE